MHQRSHVADQRFSNWVLNSNSTRDSQTVDTLLARGVVIRPVIALNRPFTGCLTDMERPVHGVSQHVHRKGVCSLVGRLLNRHAHQRERRATPVESSVDVHYVVHGLIHYVYHACCSHKAVHCYVHQLRHT